MMFIDAFEDAEHERGQKLLCIQVCYSTLDFCRMFDYESIGGRNDLAVTTSVKPEWTLLRH